MEKNTEQGNKGSQGTEAQKRSSVALEVWPIGSVEIL